MNLQHHLRHLPKMKIPPKARKKRIKALKIPDEVFERTFLNCHSVMIANIKGFNRHMKVVQSDSDE